MNHKEYLDIVFEHRNKAYGAFSLRSMYNKNVGLGLAISVFSFLTTILITYDYCKSLHFNSHVEKVVAYQAFDANVYKVELPNLTPTISSSPKRKEPKKEIKPDVKPEIKKEFKKNAPVKVVKEEPKVEPKTSEKKITSEKATTNELNSLIKERKDTIWTVETKTSPVTSENPSEMAAPIGGLAEFIKYIQKNIVYPAQAKAANQEGTVYVQFTVDIDGSLTDIKVMKGFGYGCDEEAIRVVKTSPKWKPALNNGVPVRQVMRVPAKFKLPQ